jgi:cytochrome c-type biogenesis protein CcmH/NrfG
MTGRPLQAEEALRRALKLDPSLAPAHRLLGNALVLCGRLGEAVEWWERWLGLPSVARAPNGDREQVVRAVRAARDLEATIRGTHG